ncbi:MAG: antitoxin [Hyphomicrobiaceae bacterium]
MSSGTAKIFMHGRSQAVRLPKEFRLPGKECRIRREGKAVILEPIEEAFDCDAWWARIDALRGEQEFLPEGVPEPELPADEIDLDANGDAPGGTVVR